MPGWDSEWWGRDPIEEAGEDPRHADNDEGEETGQKPRKLTIIESPFAADRKGAYLERCLADSWSRGELPFASHAFFPRFLNEDNPAERKAGIEAGYEFWQFAERVVFYLDHGWSKGMEAAYDRLEVRPGIDLPWELRKLPK